MRSLFVLSSVLIHLVVSPLTAASPRLRYFCEDYEGCRLGFVSAAKKSVEALSDSERAKAQIGKWTVPSKKDRDLTIDYVYYPAQLRPRGLLILTSGVHGVEGFAGSAMQQMFLAEHFPKLDRRELGVVVIHTVNPFGMKNLRRVSENNVDLNRNFDTDRKLFSVRNDAYAKLNSLLNPETPASSGLAARQAFFADAMKALSKESLKVLRQAALGGQYEFSKGIFYGGNDFEPQKTILESAIVELARPYRSALILDIHTGYGKKATLHLFPSEFDNKEVRKAAERVFAGHRIEEASGDDFYASHGDFSTYLSKLLIAEKKLAIPMLLEFGTIDNTTQLGGIESLRRMIAENRAHHYGTESPAASQEIRHEFMELYFPKAAEWREKVIETAALRVPEFVENYRRLATE